MQSVCGQIDWIHWRPQTGFRAQKAAWNTQYTENKRSRCCKENAYLPFYIYTAKHTYTLSFSDWSPVFVRSFITPSRCCMSFMPTLRFFQNDFTKRLNSFLIYFLNMSSAVKKLLVAIESGLGRPSHMQPTKACSVFTWHQSNAKTTRTAGPTVFPWQGDQRYDEIAHV